MNARYIVADGRLVRGACSAPPIGSTLISITRAYAFLYVGAVQFRERERASVAQMGEKKREIVVRDVECV